MAWTTTSEQDDKYLVGTESVTLPDSGGASETSVNTSTLEADVSDTIFGVAVTVTETSAGDAGAEVRLQGSVNETNWHTVDTTSSMALDTTGSNSATEDLVATDTFFPYWRLQVFSDGTDTQDDATLTVEYAVKER